MIGALWTGISGLSSHQTALDNESHNIANVNTIGYKSSRISFADQMYQDRIGKGSKILDAEKLYVQGNLKTTGVNYDVAISGDGFFTVKNTTSSGSGENYYTRAGNFRMGDNGTLQDAAGNEVQGWAMRVIDTDKDVVTTDPNNKRITDDYTKLLSSKVIKYASQVETITAKATDYNKTARADSSTVFSGAGAKTKAAKVTDIENLVANYASWLQKLQDDPYVGSASSTSQVSQINFKSFDSLGGTDSGAISKDGDSIYVYIDGEKISQEFVSVTATYDINNDGSTAADDTSGSTTFADADNLVASRIATYKALADKISEEVPGLRAYMVSETGGTNDDVLEDDDIFKLSTKDGDMIKGIIQIESLIPGVSFDITEVGEEIGENKVAGGFQTSSAANAGEGVGALNSARDALARAISGKQQDVYTISDLGLNNPNTTSGALTAQDFLYGMTIYDKELDKIIPVPGDNTTNPATPLSIFINDATTVDEIVDAINNPQTEYFQDDGTSVANSSFQLSDYVVAKNINGNLVIETKDENYDVEFSGSLKIADNAATDSGGPLTINNYTPRDKNNDYSGRQGAGAEFIQMVTTINQTSTQDSLQLKLDALGISDSAFGEFSVDSTGLITMKQDGASFAIGQISLATFNNNRGLEPVGDNNYAKTNESGDAMYNKNNENTGKIENKTLELSTADLSESLVNLMVFQRAFEANAKSITTSDELLNTLINLKR